MAGFVRRGHASRENDDGLVVKLDAHGTELWCTTLGSESAADRLYGVASHGAGGAFVTAYSSGLQGGPGAIKAVNAGREDTVVAHLDGDGAVTWSHQFGSSGEDKGFAVSAAPDGDVFIGGRAGAAVVEASTFGGYDGWVVKFDARGEQVWLNHTGTDQNDQVSGLITTAAGVAATGFTHGALATPWARESDLFVTSVADDGRAEWTTQVGSASDDQGAAIAVDTGGQLLVVGHTSGRLGSGPVPGGVDVFGLTLGSSGTLLEVQQLGSVQRDGADDYAEANPFIAGAGQPGFRE